MSPSLRYAGNAWPAPIGKKLTNRRITYWQKQGKYGDWVKQERQERTKKQKRTTFKDLFKGFEL